MRKINFALALAILLQGSIAEARDEEAGRKIAERLCARCHAIGPRMIGPHPRAPTFKKIASSYSVWGLQEALAEGIVVGHAAMPEFKLTPQDINSLLTYMDTLTPPKKLVQ